MSSTILAFGSNRNQPRKPWPADAGRPRSGGAGQPLSQLREGAHGVVVEVRASDGGRVDRLLGLGVTPGARITVLQTFPGIVFLCDQTELAVERVVAESIIVRSQEIRS
jgi:Fe2+ transport system protein FeoA